MAAAGPTPQALRLGYAGLLPFVAAALLVWLLPPDTRPYAVQGLSAYAALILSFLGGIHWGLALRQPRADSAAFVWAVVPSLVAWLALALPAAAGLLLHALMLVVCWRVDCRLYPREGVAAWLPLRFRLSAVAAASCLVGAAGA